MKSLPLFIALFLCISLSLNKFEVPTNEDQEIEYTFYAYEREWPATICKTNKCKKQYILNYDGQSFSQHGLWPNGQKGNNCKNPFTCTKLRYVQSLLDSNILSWMDQYFVGLYSSAESFRGHEFTKHGTCYLSRKDTNSEQQQNLYFGQIMNISQKYSLDQALSAHGIYPSDHTSYGYNDVYTAIASYFGPMGSYDINLRCVSYNGQQLLGAIQLFFNLDFTLGKDLCHNQQNLQDGEDNGGFYPCSGNKPIFLYTWNQQEFLSTIQE